MRNFTLGIAILFLVVGTAHAGSMAEESIALGYQTEHAGLVAMADLVGAEADRAGNYRATFSVTETIRGEVTVGSSVVVEFPAMGLRPPWVEGRPHLLFLVPRRDVEGVWSPVAGAASLRAIPETGTITLLPGMVRKIAATLPTDSRPADPDALRDLFVSWMQDRTPGIAWSAAVDFVRRRDLHEGLSDADRAKILTAFAAHPFGKGSKDALAMAVAVSRPAGAGAALVEALVAPEGRTIRGTVAEALAAIDDATVPATIAKKLEGAGERQRADLVMVLGAVGGKESVDTARKLVTDKSTEVRLQATHALGRIARRIREDEPAAKVAGTTDLEGLLAVATTKPEQQAALWALAQLQDPEAVTLLATLAKDDERAFVRTWAKRYRDRPRLSLIIR